VGDNNKRALYAGMLVAETPLPTDSPGDGQVRWEDGTWKAVHAISAAQALRELTAAATAPCADC
jgi:hypothetical protein